MPSLSVDDVSVAKAALASSAEAAAKTVKITASGGVEEVPGTWSDDKAALLIVVLSIFYLLVSLETS